VEEGKNDQFGSGQKPGGSSDCATRAARTEGGQTAKLAQMAVETALHDALFCLHEEREFRIQALTRDGDWINITEYSDGIHGDLFDWLERYSKYGCVTNEFIKVK
jgi:hypothetical protein